MKNDQQSGQSVSQGSQSQQSGKSINQSQLETIIRQGKFGSQQEANSYLQPHGLSCQMRDDGTAEIFEGQSNRVATVSFQSSGKSQSPGDISNITY